MYIFMYVFVPSGEICFLFLRALPDYIIHTALLILVVHIDIWKPTAVSWLINEAAGERGRVNSLT